MFSNAVKLVFSGRVTTNLWLFALIVSLVVNALFVFLDEERFPDLGPGQAGVTVGLLLIAVVLMFVTYWYLTRALGAAAAHEHGRVGPWIGWTIVALVPAILLAALIGIATEFSQPEWIDSFILTLGLCLMVPVLVHADGRAINGAGPSIGRILDYWLQNYGRLFVAYMFSTMPFVLAADGLDAAETPSLSITIIGSFLSAVLNFASSVLSIAVTVIAYREAEAAQL